jgi:hypothetical protein
VDTGPLELMVLEVAMNNAVHSAGKALRETHRGKACCGQLAG